MRRARAEPEVAPVDAEHVLLSPVAAVVDVKEQAGESRGCSPRRSGGSAGAGRSARAALMLVYRGGRLWCRRQGDRAGPGVRTRSPFGVKTTAGSEACRHGRGVGYRLLLVQREE